MNESEAKKEIEHNVFCNTDNFEITMSKQCYKTIIKALEKQVPKKPNDEIKTIPSLDEDGYYVDAETNILLLCPICGNQVGIDDCVDNYCSCCGQAIDWSDEE